MEAERLFKQALKAGEGCYRRSQQLQHHGTQYEAQHSECNPCFNAFPKPVIIMFKLGVCSDSMNGSPGPSQPLLHFNKEDCR